ncbi:hypothetical protein MAR_019564 [Mya arenaria]|uniref:Uncharacterized protein n=1 Tax=Mya arenaria TaxID=6604 RepID=A0ABY7E5G7_MYAAR|nr:hypothetical protein MAR_019564 [Mya arenaria]
MKGVFAHEEKQYQPVVTQESSTDIPISDGNPYPTMPDIELKMAKNVTLAKRTEMNLDEKLLDAIDKSLFQPMEKPGRGDWLKEHKESGQTYKHFVSGKKIY